MRTMIPLMQRDENKQAVKQSGKAGVAGGAQAQTTLFGQVVDQMNVDTRPHILLVDDRKENLYALESLIGGPEVQITSVASGQEALEQLLIHEFAVVVMDVQMPVMDGYETAELMRSNSRTKHIPIIFVSAVNKEEHHLFKGYDSGAVDYLFKPLEPKILLSKIGILVNLYKQKKKLEETTVALESSLSELRNKDAQIRQQQKLDAIGHLVSGVAHEVRNPLSFMMTHLRRGTRSCKSLVKRIEAGEDVPSIEELEEKLVEINRGLETTLDGADRIKKIVHNLSTFAKDDRSEKRSSVDVNGVMKKVLTLAKHEIESKSKLVVSFGEVGSIIGSENSIFQVFLNILMNALQSFDGQSTEDNKITIRSYTEHNDVVIEIHDTGCGMSDEVQERIFDPFYTTKETGAGTGLGLATCYGIVQSCGGRITVQSQSGEGSMFRIIIPGAR